MKIKVRNISDKTQSLKARVFRNGQLVETEFQILPKSSPTLSADTIFEIDNPVVMLAKGLTVLSVEQGPQATASSFAAASQTASSFAAASQTTSSSNKKNYESGQKAKSTDGFSADSSN